jgi:DNA ligase-1
VLFSALAEAFQAIEETTSRQAMTARLADLLRAGREDAGILPYLLQGQLGPPYAAPNLGLDERRVALALAAATDTPEEQIQRLYADYGDLGVVAEHLLPMHGQSVTVREVYERLREIAAVTGSGAYAEKVGRFADLLRRAGGPPARYLVRIALGRLRLGVGDATVIDALATAIGDVTARPAIVHAYTRCSDLGLVAAAAFAGGRAALERIQPAPGRPVMPALAERLPTPAEIIRRLGRVIAEPKYDGLRLQAHRDGERVWLFTRRLEDVTAAFPDVVRAVRQQVAARQVILDGEIVSYDPSSGRFLPFQETARRRRRHHVEEMEARYPLRYFAFDLLFLDGEDLLPLPQRERSRRLREIIRAASGGIIETTLQIETDDARALETFLAEMLRRGLEGVVVKRPDAAYHAGARQFNWVKLKREYVRALADTFDLVVVGYDRGRGKRAHLGIGSFLGAVYDPEHDRFRTVTRVGSGLTDEEWIELRERLEAARCAEKPARVESRIIPDVWVEPRYVIEVVAGQISRSPLHTAGQTNGQSGYALRFPRASRFRFDRRPEDATTEREIIEMYQMQTSTAAGGPG